jgi:hypothetical protein
LRGKIKAKEISTRINGETQKREIMRYTTPAHIGHQLLQMHEVQALHFAKKDLRQQEALCAHSQQRTRGVVDWRTGTNVPWQRQHSALPLGLETRREAQGN